MTPTEELLRFQASKFHPSHASVRCSHCHAPHIVRLQAPGAVDSLPPSRGARLTGWVRENVGLLFVAGLFVGMLLFIFGGGGWVLVGGR